MPAGTRSNMRRYGSAGSLNTTAGMRFSATGGVNVDDNDLYQSNPDLTNNHHRRGSSTDSMDSSPYNHSRQSSEDIEIPTRTRRTQRKVSTSTVDPLQFVKSKPSDALAKQAQEQIKAAKEVKHVRAKVEKEDDDWQSITDTLEDWQSNLSSWKHKRRRASAATYQRVEETDSLQAEEEEKRKPKTYNQMLEAREKRKSTGMLNFYPVNDEEDSLTWTPKSPTRQEVQNEEPIGRSHVTHSETAPSSRLVQRFKRSDTAPTVRESHAKHSADVKESAPVTMETVSKNRSIRGDVKDMASTGHDTNVKVVASPDLTSNRDRSLSSSSGGDSYVKYDDQNVADWAKGGSDEESESKNKTAESAKTSSTDKKADEVLLRSKTFDDKFNRGKSSDVTKRYSDIIPPWNRDSTKEKTPENHSSNAGRSVNKISNILKSFETKTDDKSHDKPKKSFEFSAEAGRKRAQWQNLERQEKEKSPATHSRPLGKLTPRNVTPEKPSSQERKDYVEKNIKINQKPNNAKGFGFIIQGGVDRKQPVTVHRVNIGSAADVCELCMKDQILAINKKDVTNMTHPQVQHLIDVAVKVGQIDLKIRRPISDEDDLEDEAFEESPKLSHQKPDHTFSSSHHSNPPHHKPVTSHHQNSPVLKSKEESHSPPMREEKKSPPVPAKRVSTGRIRDDPEEQKKWILEHLGSADPSQVQESDEPNNNDLKNDEESESSTESESDHEEESPAPIISHPQQEVVIRPQIEVFRKNEVIMRSQEVITPPQIEVSRKQEVPREPEREVTETRPTISVNRHPVPEPYQSTDFITPQLTVKTESALTPDPQETPPPPPPAAAPPPLKVSSLDVDGFKPPDILRRWQRGSRGTRSDYSSSPTSMDSDGEKRLSSSSFSWQNEAEFNNTGGSQTSPASTMSYEKDFSEPPVEPQVGQPIMLHIEATPTSQLIIDPRNQVDYDEPSLPQYNFHVDFSKQNDTDEHSLRQREEDEKERLREKEERLRRQEEQLRQEKEQLKEEQERIRREKEEIEKMKHHDEETSHAQRNGHHKPSENLTQFSVTKDTSQTQPRRLEEVWNPNNQNNKDKQRWSREDMMAMNRKATPLQKKPENEGSDSESRQAVNREPLSRSDIHNLNAAPKPKFKSTNEVTLHRDQKHSEVPRRRSEYTDPNSHWLVEEAERRREKTSKRHSVHTPYHGPIKPVSDGISNRWRDDSGIQHQQTFSSSVSASPRPVNTRQFSANTHHNLSQTLPANYNVNAGHKREPVVPPKPARRTPASPTSPPSHAEQIMAVSGKQLCSHCNQELGFGAAMVIESLGLYYHVQCFRCCVCHTALGNGSQGADVRVRVNKLHCRNCYSNDEGRNKRI